LKAKAGVTTDPLSVHASEYGNLDIDVVVDDHTGLARPWPKDPPDVLDDAALESDRKRQEHGVERGTVEALPEEACSGNEDRPGELRP
jgi:hypothetical protein